ncbi:Transcriptional modulator of MazE/toxin, MazF [Thermobacillus xylanilyticus]|jgi:Growth inhibitor|nr:Transcriptional modulator of MazE/toxin, MazF [Thermobacillus xylanilyticus]
MMYKQGDILLIPFPFTDLSSTKQRPVLVLSNTKYNESNQDIVVAAITSNLTEKEYSILITANDLDEGKLKVDSLIRADKIYTFSNQIVIRKFGHLKAEVYIRVKDQIEKLIRS